MMLWGPVQVINYGFIPQNYRLLWVDFIEIAWCFLLATVANAASEKT
jgi:hypothetical protein